MRTSVSVTPDLRRRMTEAAESGVNWSQIACAAFELRLAELDSARRNLDFEGIVQRLRASKLRASSERYSAGAEAGRTWLHESAEWPVLERLERDHERVATIVAQPDREGLPEDFLCLLDVDIDPEGFWGHDYTEGEVDGAFIEGFTDAALALFRRVKRQLAA